MGQLFHRLALPISANRLCLNDVEETPDEEAQADQPRGGQTCWSSTVHQLGQVDLEEFRQGLMGHHKAAMDTETGLLYEGVLLTGKVVLEHVQEFADYYSRLAKLEAEVDD